MKANLTFRLALSLFVGLLLIQVCNGQAPSRSYSEVYFHKLKPGHTIQEAQAIEKEWKKLHQAQLDDNHITGWYMLSKVMSSNPDRGEYDYITIKTFGDMGILENSYPAKYNTKVYGSEATRKWEDLMKRTGAIQEHGKMEIWETLDGIFSEKFTSPNLAPIWLIEMMKVKDARVNDYLTVERNIKDLHKERIAMNNIMGWNVAGLMYPAGSEKGYNFATLSYFPSTKEMADQKYAEAFKKVHPDGDMQKLANQVYDSRDKVRQEVYYLLEYVSKNASAQTAAK
ncbi:hypothetical protein [Telluribacter sp. SYSU D00476]|uniref:hypothetical protein n=1 Tax=Telluribacter sp. SYSU D00476 TaxID=2811430 RepID=UPI001FF206C6|nr:hypothetical protein [Telluribacter sp. SYSU D00476]